MSVSRIFVLALGAASAAASAFAAEEGVGTTALRKGEIVASIRSTAKPEQSYALYLPSGYSAEKIWPIVYVFDPGANGTRPLERMKDAAERYGYVLVASNNSRNGPWAPTQQAATEMWDDTHRRLAIDDARVYFAGFSGGARVSSQIAQLCRCARGVFLSGAGYSIGAAPSREAAFAVYGLTGLGDFNYGELVELDAKLETLGFRHYLHRFEGEHTWAPAPSWMSAFGWASLTEMKDGRRDRDEGLIAAELTRTLAEGKTREDAGEPAFALQGYRAMAVVFDGLADATPLKERAAALEGTKAVREQRKQEKADIERQRALEAELLQVIDRVRSGDDAPDQRMERLNRVRRLREELQGEKREDRRRVLQRVLGTVFIYSMETGRPLVDSGDPRTAAAYFEVGAEARPDWPWPHLSLAHCHAVLGDTKAVLRDLQQAVADGLSARDLDKSVKDDPKLAGFAETPEYRKLLASASAAAR